MKRFSVFLSAIFLCSALFAQSAPQPVTLVKAAHILDVRSGKYLEAEAVLVRENKIDSLGSLSDLRKRAPDATLIDLGDATLLPGLIDCHTHLLQNYSPKLGGDDENMLHTVATMSPASRALLGVKTGMEDVEAGITAVRDVGNSGVNGDVALRDAIESGWVNGPRIFASTRALSAAGGQFGDLQPAAQTLVAQEYAVVENPNAARDAVQQAFYDGADLIKVIVNTGPRVVAPDTLKAIVEEAHRVHRKVAAHATTADATRIAADAGVDSIEHGYTLADDVIKIMAVKHIYLVPTDYPADFYVAIFGSDAVSPDDRKKALTAAEGFVTKSADRLKRAVNAGVPIAFGSDEYYDVPGLTRGEASLKPFEAYVHAGMTTLQIIQAATSNAADLLGASRLGAIEKDKAADLIAMPGDPLKEITALEKVKFVMLRGRVVKNELSH